MREKDLNSKNQTWYTLRSNDKVVSGGLSQVGKLPKLQF